jgi:L-rhamnose mutarotase
MECDDWAAFERAVQRSPNQAEWAKKVYHMFETQPDREGGMAMLQEAFHMDEEVP